MTECTKDAHEAGTAPTSAGGPGGPVPTTSLRVGIVGLGVISRFYLAAFSRTPGTRLVAVCDPDERAWEVVPPRLPRYRDHRHLLRRHDVDAVVVTVPNDLHHTVCRDALAAGKAVCVEKPLATSVDEARRLVTAARRHGVPLFTSFHRRYNRAVRALVDRLPAGVPVSGVTVRYEETIEEHAGRDRWYLEPARCGGGCLADNGPNAFDLVRLLLGDVRVTDVDVRRDARGVDRRAVVTLAAPSGADARVVLDWSYPGERKTVAVRLADGRSLAADMLAGHPGFKGSLWHEYEGVLRDFTAVVAGRRTAPDGLAVAELVAAAYAPERAGEREEVR